jgi:hypothetical protein
MKSLNAILQGQPSFEPSRNTKDLILNSIKQPFSHLIGSANYEIPGFFSYNVKKYNQYIILIALIYILELFAAISVIVTTNSLFYILIKMVFILVLIYLDLIIAKHNRSKDNELSFIFYKNKFYLLVRDFYRGLLNTNDLQAIDQNINENEKEIRKNKSFTNKMLGILYLLAIIKIFVFYLDFIVDGFHFSTIMTRDAGVLICFFGSPVVYLLIPILVWVYYGKWIWTGSASTELINEADLHEKEINKASTKGFGTINYCIEILQRRPISLNCLISNLSQVIGKADSSANVIPTSSVQIQTQSGSHYKIYKEKDNYYIDILGLLSDDDILQIVSNESNIDSKKLLLLLCMSYQLIISQRESKNINKDDFENLNRTISNF